jgi:hypothetical protein
VAAINVGHCCAATQDTVGLHCAAAMNSFHWRLLCGAIDSFHLAGASLHFTVYAIRSVPHRTHSIEFACHTISAVSAIRRAARHLGERRIAAPLAPAGPVEAAALVPKPPGPAPVDEAGFGGVGA